MRSMGNSPLALVHALALGSSSSSSRVRQWEVSLSPWAPVAAAGAAQRRPQLGAPWVQLGVLPNSPLPGFVC